MEETQAAETSQPKPVHVNLVLMGKLGVGKSAMVVRFLTKKYIGEYDPNIGSIYSYKMKLEKQDAEIEILDTGSKSFVEENEAFALWGDTFMLIYAINDRASFQELICTAEYLKRVRGSDDPQLVLVGNKKDAEKERDVTTDEGEELAKKLSCAFYEVSTATSCAEIDQVFTGTIKDAVRKKLDQMARSTSKKGSHFKMIEKYLLNRNRALSSLKETIDEYCITREIGEEFDVRDRSSTCTF